ncbi:MAG: amino acid permease [Sedimentisphaerales bacterium]|nr:amino acid permease [Sedimentisphaerales bacterium]
MSVQVNGKETPSSVIRNRLGAFGGVFTPSILTILGVIMFMRVGFVLGQVGIFQMLAILFLAKGITTLTSLSISAVSTNTPVAGGGAYFLISRALGPEFGGAIGLVLFLAQVISVPFYILGFTEALIRTFPEMALHFRLFAVVTALLLFCISYIGAQVATKTQYFIMAVLFISIVAFMGGAAVHFDRGLFWENWSFEGTGDSLSFWAVFAIYFPAVTGIMAGVNMSGDLKNPGRSIPLGTLAAVGVGLLIYAAQILLCGGAQTREQMLNASFETLCNQALFGAGFLVVAGVFAATLSSALGSFLGAPRVLQAVGRDKIVPMLGYFSRGSVRGDEPRRALVLTLAITLGTIFWAGQDAQGGAFNALAAVVTMFFLYTYGMVNLAAFIESFAGNPSFRPRFKFYHWLSALTGALGCTVTAFLIDYKAASVAASVLGIFYIFLRRQVLQSRFGDARWGFIYSRVRDNMLKLAKMPLTAKNWRPTVLVLTGNPEERYTLAMYALWIGEGRGMVILARVLVGELDELVNRRKAAIDQLDSFLEENDFKALSTAVVSRDLDEGLSALLQGHPISPLKPSVVLLGWSSDRERSLSFGKLLNSAKLLGMSLILLKDDGLPAATTSRRIDIWWRGHENGSLMILLAHLLILNWEWSESKVRILRLIEDEAGRLPATQALDELIEAARVKAESQIIVSKDSFCEIVHRHSQNASVVFLGFNIPEEDEVEKFQAEFEKILTGLPTTLLVCSTGETDLLA